MRMCLVGPNTFVIPHKAAQHLNSTGQPNLETFAIALELDIFLDNFWVRLGLFVNKNLENQVWERMGLGFCRYKPSVMELPPGTTPVLFSLSSHTLLPLPADSSLGLLPSQTLTKAQLIFPSMSSRQAYKYS